jgi:two-component system, OmpR family, KDP operon response regulator KdpE
VKILVIEDSPQVINSLRLALKVAMPEAELVTTGEGRKGVELVETESPDIVLLDLGLPDIDGTEVLKDIRLFSNVPVIILTVRDSELDEAGGLEMGADDYVTKPWRPLDLVARIRASLRRRQGFSPGNAVAPLVAGPLIIDSASRQVTCNGQPVHLTPTQYAMLSCLVRNRPRVVPHDVLAREVWGDEDNRLTSVKSRAYELRQKLDDRNGKIIESVRGTGYRFVP